MVPMPEGVILDPILTSDFGKWWGFIRAYMRVKGKWYRPLYSLRSAVFAVNHGTKHNGSRYRSCYRWSWMEKVDA